MDQQEMSPRKGLRFTPPGIALAVILAFALVWQLCTMRDRDLHTDETHYARCAGEIGIKGNFLLQSIWNDRGLVQYYIGGLFHFLFGFSDRVSFLPNLLASLGLIGAGFAILRRLKSARAGLLAAALLALCPQFVAYAPTVFNEPLTVFWVVAAVWAAIAARPFTSGLLFALGVCTKQIAPVFAPLVGSCLLASAWYDRRPQRGRVLSLSMASGDWPGERRRGRWGGLFQRVGNRGRDSVVLPGPTVCDAHWLVFPPVLAARIRVRAGSAAMSLASEQIKVYGVTVPKRAVPKSDRAKPVKRPADSSGRAKRKAGAP